MPGTLTISTLSDGTNSTSATNPVRGSARAWAQFNGLTGATNGSFNISSVTRTSAGQYTVNMTNALANANYSVVVSASPNVEGTVNAGIYVVFTAGGGVLTPPTTSQFQFTAYNPAAGLVDPNYVCISVFSA